MYNIYVYNIEGLSPNSYNNIFHHKINFYRGNIAITETIIAII